jgi:cytidylate kinase
VKRAIAISRQMGSGGRTVAEQVAKKLGWRLVGREVVTEAARKTGFEEEKIERVFERRVSLEDRLNFQQKSGKYLSAVSSVIHEMVEQGEVVILGRGAGVIMGSDSRLLRVHLVADLDTRIQRIAGQFDLKGPKGLDEARKRVLDSDYSRSAYHNYLFNSDWNDPLIYDLVVNTTGISRDQAVDTILEIYRIMGKGE